MSPLWDNSIIVADKSQVLWDKVVSIEYIGKKPVYDIEVEGTHNFIGNDIFAHNTYISGNVGIGTAAPGAKLEVLQTDTSQTYSVKIGTSTTAYHLTVSTMGNVYINAISSFTAGAGSIFVNGGSTDQVLKKAADGSMSWANDLGGVVGGGTVNYLPIWGPDGATLGDSKVYQAEVDASSHVYVAADIHLSSAVYFGSGVNISTFSKEGWLAISASTLTAYSIAVGTSTVYHMVVSTTGNLGIGTTNPQGLFQVGGRTMTVLSNGRVGIGTASPGAINHIQASVPDTYTMVVSTGSAASQYIISVSSIGVTNIKNLVIENRTADPTSPVTGQVWLRVD